MIPVHQRNDSASIEQPTQQKQAGPHKYHSGWAREIFGGGAGLLDMIGGKSRWVMSLSATEFHSSW